MAFNLRRCLKIAGVLTKGVLAVVDYGNITKDFSPLLAPPVREARITEVSDAGVPELLQLHASHRPLNSADLAKAKSFLENRGCTPGFQNLDGTCMANAISNLVVKLDGKWNIEDVFANIVTDPKYYEWQAYLSKLQVDGTPAQAEGGRLKPVNVREGRGTNAAGIAEDYGMILKGPMNYKKLLRESNRDAVIGYIRNKSAYHAMAVEKLPSFEDSMPIVTFKDSALPPSANLKIPYLILNPMENGNSLISYRNRITTVEFYLLQKQGKAWKGGIIHRKVSFSKEAWKGTVGEDIWKKAQKRMRKGSLLEGEKLVKEFMRAAEQQSQAELAEIATLMRAAEQSKAAEVQCKERRAKKRFLQHCELYFHKNTTLRDGWFKQPGSVFIEGPTTRYLADAHRKPFCFEWWPAPTI